MRIHEVNQRILLTLSTLFGKAKVHDKRYYNVFICNIFKYISELYLLQETRSLNLSHRLKTDFKIIFLFLMLAFKRGNQVENQTPFFKLL